MVNRKIANLALVMMVAVSLIFGGSAAGIAQTPTPPPPGGGQTMPKMRQITNADRVAAAERAKAARAASGQVAPQATTAMNPGGTPDYFGATPNYANSPLPPTVTFTDTVGSGSGAQAVATVQGGVVTNLKLLDPGAGYTGPVTVGFQSYDGTGATATATVGTGQVTKINLLAGGSGYTNPVISFNGGGGTGAAATAIVTGGVITGFTITSGGSGYTAAPFVQIYDPSPTGGGAAATSAINGIATLTLTAGGSGYGGVRKFVDTLPGLTSAGANDLGQYIPVGFADTSTYTGSDYYEIGLIQYSEQLHKDLAPTTLRGYVQIETAVNAGTSKHIQLFYPDGVTPIQDPVTHANVYAYDKPSYLGPTILAQENRPVRVKFTNFLPSGAGGDLFIPVDLTNMGAGPGPDGEVTALTISSGGAGCTSAAALTISAPAGTNTYGQKVTATGEVTVLNGKVNGALLTNPGAGYTALPTVTVTGCTTAPVITPSFTALGSSNSYSQDRATLHLHGGITPWISDGTTNQWITPAGDPNSAAYPKGVSVYNVPDMPDPGPGSQTFFYTNQQSARLMFYHDHALGITRLNVYAGEAAGYLLSDSTEQKLVNGGTVNGVAVAAGTIPADQIPLIIQDKTFVPGPNQLAAEDPTWNWGVTPASGTTHNDLWFPHVYMPNQNPSDAMGVNAMGRWDYGPWFWPPNINITYGEVPNPLAGLPGENPTNPGTPNPSIVPEGFMDTPLVNGTAYPVMTVDPKAYRLRILNAANDRTWNLQLYKAKSNGTMWDATTGNLLDPNAGEVNMVQAAPNAGLPANWPTDGRAGGVPDPAAVGPTMVQIGTEGGLLPASAAIANQPVGYEYNRRSIVVLNVTNTALFLGPAERADVIVDFSAFAGQTLILYNDAPAPVPAFDTRYDYYTGDPDQTSSGGAPTTLAGYGPNTRTVMQIKVNAATPAPYTVSTANLDAALGAAFHDSQPTPIVPEAAYNTAYGASYPNTYSRIQDTQITYTPAGSASATTINMQPKAIQELFDPNYGRMNALLGAEIPNTTGNNQTTIPFYFADPANEVFQMDTKALATQVNVLPDGSQIWKITHNGVDTHAIHWHMFNVQVINRVGWDGQIRPPDSNEQGWKDTVRMNPLEDIIVAIKPIQPTLPFKIGNSYRVLNVSEPLGSPMGFFGADPNNNPVTITNHVVNYGWEYVWHCHLLGHEENDMMHPMAFAFPPDAPTNLSMTTQGNPLRVRLNWQAPAFTLDITGYTLQKKTNGGAWTDLAAIPTSALMTYTDTAVAVGNTYNYRVIANNTVGGNVTGFPMATASSLPSNIVTAGPPAAPTNLQFTVTNNTGNPPNRATVTLRWTDNATNETNYVVQRANSAAGPWQTQSSTIPAASGSGTTVTYNNLNVTRRASPNYFYRVYATNAFGNSTMLTGNVNVP